jgi:hypothetical protein
MLMDRGWRRLVFNLLPITFLLDHIYIMNIESLIHCSGQALCAICLMPRGRAVRITPSGEQTRPVNASSIADRPDYPLLSSRPAATNGNLSIDGIDSYSGTSTSNNQV